MLELGIFLTNIYNSNAVTDLLPMKEPLTVIESYNLTKIFRMISLRTEIVAVDSLSFTAKKDEIVLLQGENGSGKSTVIRILAGLLKPTSGRVRLNGEDPRKRKTPIGLLPEQVQYHPGVSSRNFLKLLARLDNVPVKRVAAVLEQFNLSKWADFPPDVFSAGMKRRFGLAAAFLKDPQILLLDEPVESLDRESKSLLIDIIKNSSNKVFVIADHGYDFEPIATQIIKMREGKVC